MKRTIFIVSILVLLLFLCSFGADSIMPIIYSPNYNISMFGIEKLQPFETQKYGKVWAHLKSTFRITEKDIFEPKPADEAILMTVHSKKYLDSLKKTGVVTQIAELSVLGIVPGFVLDAKLLKPMRYATGGTIMGVELALKYGWAINLSGGYHHAKPDSGGGFCFYADIPIAIKNIRKTHPDLKVLVIDLDAHQGNGIETCMKGDKLTFIMDVYNAYIYPKDNEAAANITFDYPIKAHTDGAEYLKLIDKKIDLAIMKSKPGLIIYNAGTDVLEGDNLGMLNLLPEDVVMRDEMIFAKAFSNNVPILMVLSGGYTKESAEVIGKSIENICKAKGIK